MFPTSPYYCILIDGKEMPEWMYKRCTKVVFKEPEDGEASVTLYFVDHDLKIQDSNVFNESKSVVTTYMGYIEDNGFVMDGLVEKIGANYPKEGNPTLEIKIKNISTSMNKNTRFAKYNNMTYSDIAISIAKRYNMRYIVTNTKSFYNPYDTSNGSGINQSGLTDYVFLQQLANKINFKFYIGEGVLYFVKRPIDDRDMVTLDYRAGSRNLLEFKPELSVNDTRKQFELGNINVDGKIYVDGDNDYSANGRKPTDDRVYPPPPVAAPKPKPPAPPKPSVRYHKVVSGDYLIKISKQYYGNGNLYMKIYEANRSKCPNPNLIYAGDTLVIP